MLIDVRERLLHTVVCCMRSREQDDICTSIVKQDCETLAGYTLVLISRYSRSVV